MGQVNIDIPPHMIVPHRKSDGGESAALALKLGLWIGGSLLAIFLLLGVVGFVALRMPPSRSREE